MDKVVVAQVYANVAYAAFFRGVEEDEVTLTEVAFVDRCAIFVKDVGGASLERYPIYCQVHLHYEPRAVDAFTLIVAGVSVWCAEPRAQFVEECLVVIIGERNVEACPLFIAGLRAVGLVWLIVVMTMPARAACGVVMSTIIVGGALYGLTRRECCRYEE